MIRELNHVVGTDQLSVHETFVPAARDLRRGILDGHRRSRLRRTRAQSVDTLTRCAIAKAWREGRDVGAIRLRQASNGYAGSGLQPRSILSQQIVAPGLVILRIGTISRTSPRAPRLLSVTESIVLPPRPRGGYYVRYLQIQCSRVAGASGTAADLFCAADRCCDAYSVVVPLGGPAPSAQASGLFRPMKRAQSSLACKLNIWAADALDRARKMPPGDERAEAMKKAAILENAAEMLEHFSGKVGVRAK
jgi:hypothetical protein